MKIYKNIRQIFTIYKNDCKPVKEIEMNICIAGTGGLAREILMCLKDWIEENPQTYSPNICFMEKDEYYSRDTLEGFPIITQSKFNPNTHQVIIGVGSVTLRKKIARDLPAETKYITLIHPSAIITNTTKIGEGSVVMPGVVLSCNVNLGKHTIIDRLATIGHDCRAKDFFHLAPLSVLSGNVFIGEEVFIGTQAAIKENITICKQVLIGMGTIVTKNIDESGTYVGNPAKKL